MNINNTDWMRSGNVKLAIYLLISIMPNIVADLAEDRVSWLSFALVVSAALVAGKAYMSDPNQLALKRKILPVLTIAICVSSTADAQDVTAESAHIRNAMFGDNGLRIAQLNDGTVELVAPNIDFYSDDNGTDFRFTGHVNTERTNNVAGEHPVGLNVVSRSFVPSAGVSGLNATATAHADVNGEVVALGAAALIDGSTIVTTEGITGANVLVQLKDTSLSFQSFGTYSALQVKDTSTLNIGFGNYMIFARDPGATIGDLFGEWIGDMRGTVTTPGGTAYPFWYDGGNGGDCNSGGVARINDFGIYAYYNPCFLKYTPREPNFERIIQRWGDTGVFGVDNVAYIGVEPGGAGTNRHLQLIGGGLSFQSTLVTPARTGTRFLCISTTGVVRSSVVPCKGT